MTPLIFLTTHWNPKLNQLETSNQKEKPPILPFHRFNQFSSSFITPLSLISSLALSIKKETQESLIQRHAVENRAPRASTTATIYSRSRLNQ